MISGTREISETSFDVIVIGAGINGAGIARDAAMRGLSVLLLDKGDLGGATSSWSTRLIHGGLRYLEHGELRLVRESLRERETLLHIAPHLVKPLPMLIPIYAGNQRGPLTIRAGMIAYDLLSWKKTLPRHHMLSRSRVLHEAPALNPEGLRGAAVYFDAQVEFPERLVVENALSAERHGAAVVTHAKVEKLKVIDGVVEETECRDMLEGRSFSVRGRLVVNAAGPWVDQVLSTSEETSQHLIGGTKGSHLIVAPFAGAPETALYVEAESDGRPFFIIPWDGKYLIGTTDIRFAGDLDRLEITEVEIDYLLREANRVIPGANLISESILFTYSGVRPLPFTREEDAPSITRRHFIQSHPRFKNLISIVGGKLTIYRSLSEATVDLIFRKLGRNPPDCRTAEEALSGRVTADRRPDQRHIDQQLSPSTRERLLRIYGARSGSILTLIREDASLASVFDSETGAIAAEVVYAFKHELARTLADCLLRRTMVGLNSTMGIGADIAAAKIAQEYLGWSEDRARSEVESYRNYVERFRRGLEGLVS